VKILGIETATMVCAAAVVSQGGVVHEMSLDRRNVHAEKLMTMIDAVLVQSQCTLADLDGIAVSIGPGSFTGLRIGLSVAKGLVYVSAKPLIAVPTLEALARKAIDAGAVGPTGFLLPALEARRDEIYCQLFRVDGKTIEPVWAERDMSVSSLAKEIGNCAVTVTGDACPKLSSMLPHSQLSMFRFTDTEVSKCSAGSVARIGERRLNQGKSDDPVTLEPRYIKEFFSKAT
jgi:tRNA threonylcarbamoyladenosine biosynthesis protein TsaB